MGFSVTFGTVWKFGPAILSWKQSLGNPESLSINLDPAGSGSLFPGPNLALMIPPFVPKFD